MSRISYRISRSVTPEARPLFERIATSVFGSAPESSPVPYRQARLVTLLAADALNGSLPSERRAIKWRRFIRALDSYTPAAASPTLRTIVEENRDLIAQS